MSVVQCYLPRLAFGALDHGLIRATARYVGIERPRWEWSTVKVPNFAPPASGCLIVHAEMAVCLLEALQQLLAKAEAKQQAELATATRTAIKTLSAAIERSKTMIDRSPGFGANS